MKIFLFISIIFTMSAFSQTKVISYNLSLDEHKTKYAKVRLPFISDYLYHSGADVLCLQEVWDQKDRDYLISSLGEKFPYHFHSKSTQKYADLSPTCATSELFGEEGILSCLWKNCLFQTKKELGRCFQKSCPELIRPLIKQNQVCAESLLGSSGKWEILSFFDLINPFKSAPRFSKKGSNGLLVLSKKNIEEKSVYDLGDFSTYYSRGVLHTQIEDIDFYCTQLTGDIDYFLPYMGPFESWDQENKKQMTELIQILPKTKGPLVLMGNLSCSKAHPSGLSAQNEESCQQLLDLGFVDHLYENKPECTYCASNNLILENRQDSFLSDHIFTKNITVLKSETLFKKTVEFNSKEGELKNTQLSTNHGVFNELEKMPRKN